MKWTQEQIGRTGTAAIAAAVVGLLFISGYHPCDGLGALWILPPICGVIAVLATVPGVTPRAMLVPGLAAATVLGIAVGLDYSGSGRVSPGGVSCEPVPGLAGFGLAATWAFTMAAFGLGVAMLVAWPLTSALKRPAAPTSTQENGAG